MPPKRKNENEPTARERKKQKMDVARTIAVQPVSAHGMANPIPGPSKVAFTNSMTGLPGALDVEKFAEARAFEINAMEEAMKNVGEKKTTRVWQELPRHLRRRAASHDVRRVPVRLRGKARAEMDTARRKALGRPKPKRGKDKRVGRTEVFLKRQRSKTWLETHIWHAKRMHMEDLWGYTLAVTPTEKAFRPSHRASVHGSILHDASYYGVIELNGPEQELKSTLEQCCDPQGPSPGSKRYSNGVRVLDTHIYKTGAFPFDLIGPIAIMWRPAPTSRPDAANTGDAGTKRAKGKGKGKNKADQQTSTDVVNQLPEQPRTYRTIWIQCHPTVFDQVFAALQTSISVVLDTRKNIAGNVDPCEIEIADLRGHVNIFEIMGPKSSQIIKGALKPLTEDKRQEFKKFWSSLTDLQSPCSVPRGMVIGFQVYDPRLSFPPKNAKPRMTDLSNPVPTFPSSTLAQSEIWDENIRNGLRKPRYKKKDLDDRRSKNLVPGTPLNVARQDDRVPVLLIQRSVESTSSTSQITSASGQSGSDGGLHGWTLIIPAGWSMPFFMSLTHTGTRVGGQREHQIQSFEAGTSYFPRDYPFTDAYAQYADRSKAEEKARWDKKPPAKRVNYEKLGTRSPWEPDWEVVLGLKKNSTDDEDYITTQRDVLAVSEGLQARPWLLRGLDVPAILENVATLFIPSAGLIAEINRLRLKRQLDPLDSAIKAEILWKGALVMVKVKPCRRGAPSDLAMVYSLDDLEVRKWHNIEAKRSVQRSSSTDESAEELELSNSIPPPESVVGYVTTGAFSLSRGQGYAIGAIPIARLYDLKQQAQRLQAGSTMLVKVRDRQDTTCRAAYIEVVSSA